MLNERATQLWNALDIGALWVVRGTPEAVPAQETKPARATNASAVPAAPAAARPDVRAQAPAVRAKAPAVRPAPAKRPAPRAEQTTAVADPELLAKIAKADWDTLKALTQNCRHCVMSKTRMNPVFSEGGPGAKIVLVGAGPDSEDDLQGQPFVGKSGQLLTQMLESINLKRGKDIAIVNVLKCRTPGNRKPQPDEIACCEAILKRQLELIAPQVVFLMGRQAMQTLLHAQAKDNLEALRGRVHLLDYGQVRAKAVVSYHPSYLMRSPLAKAQAWEDLLLLKETLKASGIAVPEKEKQWM